MDLAAKLARAIEAELAGVPLAALQNAAAELSARYRAETRDGRLHAGDALAVQAYLATRMPATLAASAAAFAALADLRPDFAPTSLLDIGAGTGAVLVAARDRWAGVAEATLVEASPAMRAAGARLAMALGLAPAPVWLAADVGRGVPAAGADLVTAAYLLGELGEGEADRLTDAMWACCRDTVVLVEPGTPTGWRRILRARGRLIAAGAFVAGPCAHAAACPLAPPDWCHFAARVARSRLHRRAKDAELGWEDEKFIWFAASRQPSPEGLPARVLARPRGQPGRVSLKLCLPDGRAAERLVTRREGDAFRAARRAEWGDAFRG